MDDVAAGAVADQEDSLKIGGAVDPRVAGAAPGGGAEPREGGEAIVARRGEAVLGGLAEVGRYHECACLTREARVDGVVHAPVGVAEAEAAAVEVEEDGEFLRVGGLALR